MARNEVADKLRNLRKLVDAGTNPDDRITVSWIAGRLTTFRELSRRTTTTTTPFGFTCRRRKRPAKLTVLDVDKLWQAKRKAGYSIRIMRTVLRKGPRPGRA